MAAIATASESGVGTPCFRPLRSVARPLSIALSVENAAVGGAVEPVVGLPSNFCDAAIWRLPSLIVADERQLRARCKPSQSRT